MEIKAPDRGQGSFAARGASIALACAASLFAGYYLGTATEVPARIGAWRKELQAVRDRAKGEGAASVAGKLAAAATSAPRRLVIDIKHADYQHLAFKRQRALEHGFLVTEEDSYVPAKVTADGEMHEVRLRLKGDLVDHLEGKKWSLRIETHGDSPIWGMRRFSIQSPKRSEFLREWLMHRWLAHEGLIALRYDFVDVVVNGDALGIYALEEGFGRELVAHNRRREGPILKFDEGRIMDPGSVGRGDMRSHEDLYFAADVHSFDSGRTLGDPGQRSLVACGRTLLEGVRARTVRAADAFDIEKAARLYAMFDILQGGHHGLRWKNLRFYVDPLLGRLELVAYNAYGLHKQRRNVTTIFYQDWLAGDVGLEDVQAWESIFFDEPAFVDAYFRELRRIAAPGYLEGFFGTIEPEVAAAMAILNREFPGYASPLPGYLGIRRRVWEILNPRLPLKGYLERVSPEAASAELLVVNPSFLPVLADALTCGDREIPLAEEAFPGKIAGAALEHRAVTARGLTAADVDCLQPESREADRVVLANAQLVYHYLGEDGSRTVPLDAMPLHPETELAPLVHGAEQRLRRLAQEGVLEYDAAAKRVQLLPGSHRLTEDLVVPPGLELRAGPGTTLVLDRRAAIVSYSPVQLAGSAAAPVTLESEDGTGQGLVVLQAGAPSELRHVVARNLTSALKGRWRLTGAITFVESDATIAESELTDGASEDLVSAVRGRLRLEKVTVARSRGDAVDVEFGQLEVVDSTFRDCGADCLDLSGTTATIRGVTIVGAGDKGVSVGEESHATIDARIERARIAVASKDASDVQVTRLDLVACQVGLAAYQRRPELGPSTIEAAGVTLESVDRPVLRDAASRVTLDGSEVAGEPFPAEDAG